MENDHSRVASQLLSQLVEGVIMTRSEMFEALHKSNKELSEEMARRMREDRREFKNDLKWIAGIVISVITVVIVVANYVSHLAH